MVIQYGLGIDLGTTQTAAAVRVDGRVEVVRLGARRPEIPSLVFVKPDGGLLIGDAAERRGQAEPARLAREFKRRIGDPVPILVGGSPFSAHALTAKLLRHVLDSVRQLQDGPPAVVTVTHPANWGPYKREQLDQAVRLADAAPVVLRTEPEAAALQHATARRIASGETVAVYDLGGGTFDAAVLRRDGDGFVLLGEPEGIEQLGGIDFDEAVFGHVVGVLGNRAENLDADDPEVVTALARLRRDCVEAKEALSFDTEVMIPVALPGLHTRVRLNRSELESMIAPSLEDTVDAMRRALRSAQVTGADLSAVLLAGGSSRIPLVAQLLSTAFERPVVADPHPEHSIALGAAVATAAVVGGGSPFAAAVPPSPAESRRRGSSSGNGGTSSAGAGSPPGGAPAASNVVGAGAAAASNVVGAGAAAPSATEGGTPITAGRKPGPDNAATSAPSGGAGGVDQPTAYSRGSASVSGGETAHPDPASPGGTPAASGAVRTAGVAPIPPVSAPPAGNGVPADPGGAGTSKAGGSVGSGGGAGGSGGSAAGSGGGAAGSGGGAAGSGFVAAPVAPGRPIAYPSTPPGRSTPPALPAPPGLSTPPASGAAFPGTTFSGTTFTSTASSGAGRSRTRKLVMIGAVAVALLAAGTATAVAMTRDDDGGGGEPPGAPVSVPASSAPAAAPPPFPTDTILARADQGDAFPASSYNLVSFTPGTAARTTLPDSEGHALPQWSNDRTKIATTRPEEGKAAIYVRNADGTNPQKVVDNVGGRVAWSPDDKQLAFMRRVHDVPQMFVITLGESKPRQLTWSSTHKDDPAWSPDGKTIAYWLHVRGQPQLHLLSVDDPEEPGKRLTSGESGPAADPAWSPDGKTIAYTHITGKDKSDIWLVDADGKNARPLTDHPDREMDPNYSPDGSWIGFVRGELAKPKVTIAKADGSDERVLTEGNAREGHPAWS